MNDTVSAWATRMEQRRDEQQHRTAEAILERGRQMSDLLHSRRYLFANREEQLMIRARAMSGDLRWWIR